MSDLSEELYAAIEHYTSMSEGLLSAHRAEHASKQQNLSVSQIVNVVLNPVADSSKAHLQVINQRLQYRRLYKELIAESHSLYCPQQAAASSEETILTRRADAFELSVVTSDSYEDSDIKIVLSLDDKDHSLSDTASIHCFYQDSIFPLALEQITVQKYVAKISARDAIYMALSHNDCEIFIR